MGYALYRAQPPRAAPQSLLSAHTLNPHTLLNHPGAPLAIALTEMELKAK